jgi:hypothetical protein
MNSKYYHCHLLPTTLHSTWTIITRYFFHQQLVSITNISTLSISIILLYLHKNDNNNYYPSSFNFGLQITLHTTLLISFLISVLFPNSLLIVLLIPPTYLNNAMACSINSTNNNNNTCQWFPATDTSKECSPCPSMFSIITKENEIFNNIWLILIIIAIFFPFYYYHAYKTMRYNFRILDYPGIVAEILGWLIAYYLATIIIMLQVLSSATVAIIIGEISCWTSSSQQPPTSNNSSNNNICSKIILDWTMFNSTVTNMQHHQQQFLSKNDKDKSLLWFSCIHASFYDNDDDDNSCETIPVGCFATENEAILSCVSMELRLNLCDNAWIWEDDDVKNSYMVFEEEIEHYITAAGKLARHLLISAQITTTKEQTTAFLLHLQQARDKFHGISSLAKGSSEPSTTLYYGYRPVSIPCDLFVNNLVRNDITVVLNTIENDLNFVMEDLHQKLLLATTTIGTRQQQQVQTDDDDNSKDFDADTYHPILTMLDCLTCLLAMYHLIYVRNWWFNAISIPLPLALCCVSSCIILACSITINASNNHYPYKRGTTLISVARSIVSFTFGFYLRFRNSFIIRPPLLTLSSPLLWLNGTLHFISLCGASTNSSSDGIIHTCEWFHTQNETEYRIITTISCMPCASFFSVGEMNKDHSLLLANALIFLGFIHLFMEVQLLIRVYDSIKLITVHLCLRYVVTVVLLVTHFSSLVIVLYFILFSWGLVMLIWNLISLLLVACVVVIIVVVVTSCKRRWNRRFSSLDGIIPVRKVTVQRQQRQHLKILPPFPVDKIWQYEQNIGVITRPGFIGFLHTHKNSLLHDEIEDETNTKSPGCTFEMVGIYDSQLDAYCVTFTLELVRNIIICLQEWKSILESLDEGGPQHQQQQLQDDLMSWKQEINDYIASIRVLYNHNNYFLGNNSMPVINHEQKISTLVDTIERAKYKACKHWIPSHKKTRCMVKPCDLKKVKSSEVLKSVMEMENWWWAA